MSPSRILCWFSEDHLERTGTLFSVEFQCSWQKSPLCSVPSIPLLAFSLACSPATDPVTVCCTPTVMGNKATVTYFVSMFRLYRDCSVYLQCAYNCSVFVIRIHVNTAHLSFGTLLATEHHCIVLDSDLGIYWQLWKKVVNPRRGHECDTFSWTRVLI